MTSFSGNLSQSHRNGFRSFKSVSFQMGMFSTKSNQQNTQQTFSKQNASNHLLSNCSRFLISHLYCITCHLLYQNIMLFSRHPGILSRITGALQNSGLMEMWPSEHSEASTAADPTVARPHPRAPAPETESEYHVDSNIVPPPTVHTPLFGPVPLLNQRPCTEADQRAIHLFKLLQERLALREPKTKGRRRKPVINNKKRKFREIRAEDVGPPLKKRRLCGPMKRKAEPAPAEEPPLKRRRLLSPEEINADEPADRNRRRYFELVSPLPTIPEEEEEIEGTDEEVRSEDAVVAPATTAPATEESNRRRYFELVSPLPTIPEEEEEIEGTDEEVRSEDAVVAPATTAPATEEWTIESVNVREEEVQEQPE
ncbi:MAG: hypothetical protein GY874_14140, partial [Desulfobacteraceae bacterium]|nr:hypothetical protein [Desulfobacteraceae bacterium]